MVSGIEYRLKSGLTADMMVSAEPLRIDALAVAAMSSLRINANKSAWKTDVLSVDNTSANIFGYWEDMLPLSAFGADLSVLKYKKLTSVFAYVCETLYAPGMRQKHLYDCFVYTNERELDLNFNARIVSAEFEPRSSYVGTNITDLFKRYPREQLDLFGVKIKRRLVNGTGYVLNEGGRLEGSRSSSPPYFMISYEDLPPLPPTTLAPDNGELANPKGAVTLNWEYVPDNFEGDDYQEKALPDIQTSSMLRYNVNGGTWTEVQINNSFNTYTFAANRFSSGDTVNWQVRSGSQYNGYGDWSKTACFKLGPTPPDKPVPVYPSGIVINGEGGIDLEWRYVSRYDIFPSRFDTMHRIDGGAWVEKQNAAGASTMYRIPGVLTNSRIEWRVKSYGQYGDAGEWSDIAVFHTAGKPSAPVIVKITNAGRPVIYWAADDLVVYEIEIRQGNEIIYTTGMNPYTGDKQHKALVFFEDGQYVARLRVKNEYNFYSDWVERTFGINTNKPAAAVINAVDNPEHSIKLYLTRTADRMLIYRKRRIDKVGEYRCIAIVEADYYEDYTAVPGVEYLYYARAVDESDNFSDSNKELGYLTFSETVIAQVSALSSLVLLEGDLNNAPKKNVSLRKDYKFTHYLGREFPVAEVDGFKNKTFSFSFFVYASVLDRLEELAYSREPLLIRDIRVGAAYGFISGGINIESTDFNGCTVSFSFTRIEYPAEVLID